MSFLWFLAGALTGVISGLSQQWTVRQLGASSSKKLALLLVAGFIIRLGLAGIVLYAAIQQGILAALLAFAGLWASRWGLSIYWHKSRLHSAAE